MQAISEKNHVPPTNTPNPSPSAPAPVTDYDFFFSSGSVQNVVGLNTKLHVNPD